MTVQELADLLYKALLGGNVAMVAAVARQAVITLRGHGGRVARSAARTTCTGRSATSISTQCSSGSSARHARPRQHSARERRPPATPLR